MSKKARWRTVTAQQGLVAVGFPESGRVRGHVWVRRPPAIVKRYVFVRDATEGRVLTAIGELRSAELRYEGDKLKYAIFYLESQK